MDGGTLFIYLIVAAFPALIVFAAVYKYIEVARAARWPKAQGRVVVSTTEARAVKSGGPNVDDTELRTFAKIEYEFAVGSRKYRGNRVSIGEDMGNFQVAETVRKYPRGLEVTVYYNPAKPSESVLERDMPPGIWKGIVIVVAVLVGLIVGAAVGFNKLGDLVRAVASNSTHAPFVTACIGFALLASLVIFGIQRHAARQRAWPTVRGRIARSDVQEFQELEHRDSGRDRWRTAYRADIIYNYEIDGVRYTGDVAAGGTRVSSNIESFARKMADKYPAGTVLDIRYNPDNPAESVLQPAGRWLLLLWLVPAIMLTLAYYASL